MMETIRAAANHIVIKIIFAIIILCFIFTGIGFLGFSGGNSARDEQFYIAKINGDGISRAEFEAQASLVTANAGGDISFIKQLRRNVLNFEINNYLTFKFSQDLKTNISNTKLADYIRAQKIFFENGQFSNKKYLEILQANNYTSDGYAEVVKTELQQRQVVDALITTNFVLPIDSEISSLKNQTRKVYATFIDPSVVNMDDVNISLEDEKKYYDEHQNEFFKNERVKFKYISNSKENLENSIVVTDNDIKKEFDKNIKAYSFPAKNAYSVIFITDKEQADDIMKKLSSGSDFNSIVKTVNQNSNISPYGKNGSLGWFAIDDSLPQAFKDANLKKVGQISTPIAVDGGFLIVKLDASQKAKTMDLDYAKYQISEKLHDQKLQRTFETEEDKIKAGLNHSPLSLEELAKKAGFDVFDSDWTYYNDTISILRFPEVRDVAFSDEMIVDGKVTNKISDIIPIGSGKNMLDFVIQVTDYRPEGIAPFDEVKEQIHQKLYTDIARSRFKATVDGFLAELNKSGRSDNVRFSRNYTLTRDSSGDLDKKVVDMVFDLVPSPTNKSIYGVQFMDDTSAYITVLAAVNTPKEQQDLSAELRPSIINETYYYFNSDIRSKAKIEIMPNSNL
ncbi:SurA N-terminal domain-containing protein [uncultured Gilliamella sp.]|uniref:SurA N-terminal domain-containing protein n=1 Tax=uncultured Gilliamella sp. TaxID=1193505 RepID=UPI0025D6E0FC|nr:SurA N-terminal domain-containing protein [uncultured Gilliamella sp.]